MIWIVVVGIILFLIISAYFKKHKEADEKTLRPMPEWAIIANSSTQNNRERMCYSLVIQAGTILEGLHVIPLRKLRDLMLKPGLNKSNFVLLIMSTAPNIIPENQQYTLKQCFHERQARVYLATCIEMILLYGKPDDLENISTQACGSPLSWN
ncbi:hypothetical protein [Acinetobacter baumannii]|uniref:hypothetical protein n=1 Tax=Acinetobacter baumannii TaxID=470 RepID=UPI0021BD9032|nr:hypothetical protein [Acinetobacter baumannii]